MRKTIGGLLMAAGILVAGASGLCMIILTGGALDNPDQIYKNIYPGLMGIAGVALLSGIGLVFLGRHLLKPRGPE